uniref:ATPase family AAA domain-containing protein 1-like n=1 Tax=Ciona intestinalis TaxID=7719 RepID=UPI000180B2E9|nr:ATPase family AAA domain-containing protein 1-like [Ciona intestinalis]|eukprot:XP_002129659.1 ATPase family AAA domain-containing protein 1-like [Ciona intestinalis]
MGVKLEVRGFEDAEVTSKSQLIGLIVRLVFTGAAGYFLYKYVDKVLGILDPTKKQKKASEEKAQALLKLLGKHNITDLNLTEYELNIASQLIIPKDIPVSWNQIGGLDYIVEQIKETVILPFHKRDIFRQCKLFLPPKGILLYGPPGCGKTMIAKATAREAGCAFINIEVQQLTDKWYGESQKLAAAVFSLAHKLQPAIIFIDEIDAFLQMRSDRDHEVTAMMKATFMSLWDGLASDNESQVMVMGATNRPQQIDQAILRRMPIKLNVPMPDLKQRANILSIVLEVEDVSDDVDLELLSESLNGFSGSDIREMCRHASVARVHEHIQSGADSDTLRSVCMNDLVQASKVMQQSKGSEVPYLFPDVLGKHGRDV